MRRGTRTMVIFLSVFLKSVLIFPGPVLAGDPLPASSGTPVQKAIGPEEALPVSGQTPVKSGVGLAQPTPTVSSASPATVELSIPVSGGASKATVILSGQELNRATGARLLRDGMASAGVTVSLGSAEGGTSLQLLLEASPEATVGTGQVQLSAGLETVSIPISILSVKLVPASDKATTKASAISGVKPGPVYAGDALQKGQTAAEAVGGATTTVKPGDVVSVKPGAIVPDKTTTTQLAPSSATGKQSVSTGAGKIAEMSHELARADAGREKILEAQARLAEGTEKGKVNLEDSMKGPGLTGVFGSNTPGGKTQEDMRKDLEKTFQGPNAGDLLGGSSNPGITRFGEMLGSDQSPPQQKQEALLGGDVSLPVKAGQLLSDSRLMEGADPQPAPQPKPGDPQPAPQPKPGDPQPDPQPAPQPKPDEPKPHDTTKVEKFDIVKDKQKDAMHHPVRDFLGKLWAAVGGPSSDPTPTGSGSGGTRGYCPDTSDVCHATGKTWDMMTQEEKDAFCAAMWEEVQKTGMVANRNACEQRRMEPDWKSLLGPLILTDSNQGQGSTSPERPYSPVEAGSPGLEDKTRKLGDPGVDSGLTTAPSGSPQKGGTPPGSGGANEGGGTGTTP